MGCQGKTVPGYFIIIIIIIIIISLMELHTFLHCSSLLPSHSSDWEEHGRIVLVFAEEMLMSRTDGDGKSRDNG